MLLLAWTIERRRFRSMNVSQNDCSLICLFVCCEFGALHFPSAVPHRWFFSPSRSTVNQVSPVSNPFDVSNSCSAWSVLNTSILLTHPAAYRDAFLEQWSRWRDVFLMKKGFLSSIFEIDSPFVAGRRDVHRHRWASHVASVRRVRREVARLIAGWLKDRELWWRRRWRWSKHGVAKDSRKKRDRLTLVKIDRVDNCPEDVQQRNRSNPNCSLDLVSTPIDRTTIILLAPLRHDSTHDWQRDIDRREWTEPLVDVREWNCPEDDRSLGEEDRWIV